MSDPAWQTANLAALHARNAGILARLTNLLDAPEPLAVEPEVPPVPGGSAVDALVASMGLTAFEADILALCIAVALDADVARKCALFNGDPKATHATFRLALDVFDGGTWRAFAPQGPLRSLGLLELGQGAFLFRPLSLPERVLHAVMGVGALDESVEQIARRLDAGPPTGASRRAFVDAVAADWSPGTVLQVRAASAHDAIQVVSALCAAVKRGGLLFDAADLVTTTVNVHALRVAVRREAWLSGSVTVLNVAAGIDYAALARFIERFDAPLVLVSDLPMVAIQRPIRVLDVPPEPLVERRELWQAMGFDLDADALDQLASTFAPATISPQVLGALTGRADRAERSAAVWSHCRAASRDRLGSLVDVITPRATFDDLILGEPQTLALRGLVRQMRHRYQVFGRWGVPLVGAGGIGVAALFAGPSGTGKTLAAEVIAHALQLDLYRVELSAVVSKYIGETEKNLHRIFEVAEQSGAVLLFDEADALFGKRSEVRDARDRYANLEVSYLLQRIERYQGLAVLTTNLRESLDEAFARRLRVVVSFAFPDREARAAIWRRQLPAEAAYVDAVEYERLAGLEIAGGTIRTVALDAVFHAAEDQVGVSMAHLRAAAHAEYARQARPLTSKERWW